MSARNIDYTDVRERCAANRDRERFYPNPEGDLIAELVPPRDQQTIDSTEDFVTQLAQLERGVSWDRDSSRASLRSTSNVAGGYPKTRDRGSSGISRSIISHAADECRKTPNHKRGYNQHRRQLSDPSLWRPVNNEREIVDGMKARAGSRFRPRMFRGMQADVANGALMFENGETRKPGQYAWWWLEARTGIG